MSSEWGLLGLARRTYSSYRPPDAISVRLFRFMFRFCSKAVPERGRRALLSRKGTIISVLRIPQLLHNVSIEYILSPTGRVYIVRAALSHGSCLLLRYDYLISAAVIPCRTFRKACISFPPEAQRMGIPKPR